jgi:hypothetical protein
MSDNLQQQASRDMLKALVRDWMSIGLLGAGAGAGFRGLQGIRRLSSQQPAELDWARAPSTPFVQPLPVLKRKKVAGIGDMLKQMVEPVVKPLSEGLTGKNISNQRFNPVFLPGAAVAVGGGLYGGWKLSDLLLDRARRQAIDSDLETAKTDYEQALMGKFAGIEAIDHLEKQATLTPQDAVGLMTGLSLLGMGGIGLGAGLTTYELSRKRQRPALIDKARKRRLGELTQQQTVPILFEPQTHAA